MGRRRRKEKPNSNSTETQVRKIAGGDEAATKEKGGFFACYLLTSLSPRHKGHTYIGFTVNPRRRIRQHNGEIGCGALRTKRKRPWEMVMCIYGFPTNVSALQFEWAWQHPKESLAVRKAAAEMKSLSGLANKIKLAYTMLMLPSWASLVLTVNFFSTKYTTHCAKCPSLTNHMKVQVRSMDDLSCSTQSFNSSQENEDDWGHEEEVDGHKGGDDIMFGHADTMSANSLDFPNNEAEYGTTLGLAEEYRLSCDFSSTIAGVYGTNGVGDVLLRQGDRSTGSSLDFQNDEAETSTASGLGEKYRLSDDFLSTLTGLYDMDGFVDEQALNQKPTYIQNGLSIGERQTLGTSDSSHQVATKKVNEVFLDERPNINIGVASSEQMPTHGEDIFMLGEERTRDKTAVAKKTMISSASLSNTLSSVIYVDHFNSDCKTTRLKRNENTKAGGGSPFTCGVEVIDLLTPSPDCRVSLHSKKKRVASVFPTIIDLTKSPNFVQL